MMRLLWGCIVNWLHNNYCPCEIELIDDPEDFDGPYSI